MGRKHHTEEQIVVDLEIAVLFTSNFVMFSGERSAPFIAFSGLNVSSQLHNECSCSSKQGIDRDRWGDVRYAAQLASLQVKVSTLRANGFN